MTSNGFCCLMVSRGDAQCVDDGGRGIYEPIAALLTNLYEDGGNPSDAASRASSPVRGASPLDGGRWTIDGRRWTVVELRPSSLAQLP